MDDMPPEQMEGVKQNGGQRECRSIAVQVLLALGSMSPSAAFWFQSLLILLVDGLTFLNSWEEF
jgi:hypothetical protein